MTAASAPRTATTETSSAPVALQRSPWHSPLPYLFGGLAAMLGLIAFALLILICSYWQPSLGQLNDNNGEGDNRGDLEAAVDDGDKFDCSKSVSLPVLEANIHVVIMAGDVNPTFLATPASNESASLGDKNSRCCDVDKYDGELEKQKEAMTSLDQASSMTTTTTITQHRGNHEAHVSQEQIRVS